MLNLFRIFGKIEKCAGIKKERIWLQMVALLFVAVFEALFIFLLIPFLEVFGQSTDVATKDTSYISHLLVNTFDKIDLPYNLYSLAILLCIAACLRETASAINQFWLQALAGRIERGVQQKVVAATLSATFLSTLNLGGGKFMELCNICARESTKVVKSVLQIFSIFITLLSYFVVLTLTSPIVAGFAFLIALFTAITLNFTAKRASAEGKNIVRTRELLAQQFQNVFFHLREVKINNQNEYTSRLIANSTQNLYSFTFRSVTVGVKLRSLLTVILVSGSLYLIIALKDADVLDLALLTAGLAMVMRLLPLVLNFTRIRQVFAATFPYLEQLESYMMRCERNEEPDNGKSVFNGIRQGIELKKIQFTYPTLSKPALNDLNVLIRKGETTALVGPSGAGKSTLIDLLPKLINAEKGEILIDGQDLRSFSNESLRNGIAYVPQNPTLHDGSIRYNISFSEEANHDSKIENILFDVGLKETVENLPNGLDTQIGSTGIKLSGGQVQRLAIARALFKEASIFILDEPTSSLDLKNADLVSSLISDLPRKNNVTVIVISHSWEMVSKLENMIQLESGRAVYQGKPDKEMMGLHIVGPESKNKRG